MPAWLAELPADRPLVLWASALAAALALLRPAVLRLGAGRRLVSGLHAFEGGLLATLVAVMIGLSFLQIVLRNVAQSGFVWTDPLLRHLVLWIGFLGALLATRAGRHIQIDVLSRLLPERWLRWTALVTHLLSSFVCVLLCNASFKMVRDEAAFGSTSFLEVPTWILQSVMPVALWLMAYRFACRTMDALRGDPGTWRVSLPETSR